MTIDISLVLALVFDNNTTFQNINQRECKIILHQPKRKMRQNYINNYVSFFSISVNDNIKVANYNLTAQERFVVFVLFDLFYSFQVFHYFLYSIQIPFEYFYNHFYHD